MGSHRVSRGCHFLRKNSGLWLGLAIAALPAVPVAAKAPLPQSEVRQVENPPPLQVVRKLRQLSTAVGRQATARSDEQRLDLNVVYRVGKIWNPATRQDDWVKLRSYQGTLVAEDAPFVAPMIEVTPGETIRVTLHNKLPPDPSCTAKGGDVNTPHCFNGTNLHTHGLWVNPAGNGDNVLVSLNPDVSFQYEYYLPEDHPAGTFWYHTHRHGSTALQVASGMAGALIVRGNRLPSKEAPGDIDTLLRKKPAEPYKERVLVMQQIQYACRDAQGNIKTNNDGTYRCDTGDVGGIESYDLFGVGKKPGTTKWQESGRYTSINGQVLPTFTGAKAGRIERWRIIHGGVRDTVNLEFRALKGGVELPSRFAAEDNDRFIGDHCTGDPVPQHLIAADGLTLDAVMKRTQTVFQPGYRWDALMVFPRGGRYCVIDAAMPESGTVDKAAPSRQLLGVVQVNDGPPVVGDLTHYLTQELVKAAYANLPAGIRGAVANDLQQGLKLTRFTPHQTIEAGEVKGTQELVFNISFDAQNKAHFEVDGKSYQADRIDRTLLLGSVDEWTLSSDLASHPFHIHVNPFQVVKILNPDGKDILDQAGSNCDVVNGQADTQYCGMRGVWKDTIWVKNLGDKKLDKGGKYKVVVRTRYQRYIGDFVLHCHILDHEDQGMMQNVRVALPDGAGGASHGHH